MANPYLSIGIIFRDDIRCLERCLESLSPLREAVPCELVMADTGSVDGSREIAEKYADILFDFPWVNDFAAARNAVMDRCNGRWHMFVDTDEWLDGDIKELARFIRSNNRKSEVATLIIRNYMTRGDDADYRDFVATRMVRMSTGLRFVGAIHETWRDGDRALTASNLKETIFHHDGYIGLNSEEGAAKRKRNMDLLEEELENDPENVRLLMQCTESSGGGEKAEEYIRRGIAAVETKGKEWDRFGPVIFRYAVNLAKLRNLEELEEWAARAEELFPKSYYTLIDVYYLMFTVSLGKKDYDGCVRLGEGYLRAVTDYNAGRGDRDAARVSTLTYASSNFERGVRTVLAHAYFQTGQPERAAEMLDTVEFSLMDGEQTSNSILVLKDLHTDTEIDTAPLVLRLYEGICTPTPSEKRAEERKKVFAQLASGFFSSLAEEESKRRPSCGMLAPLAGQDPLGDAAEILAAETAEEKERLLAAADKPYAMPGEVLRRCVLSGIGFPLPGRPLNQEEAYSLAVPMAKEDGPGLLKLAVERMNGGPQQLLWAKSVVQAVVGAWDWTDKEEESMELARTFSRVEEVFISLCYSPEALREDNIWLLPSMHRFGWYCGRAFQALDGGDSMEYVRILRSGLECSPRMKDMVKFLTEHVPELRPPAPSAELLEMAEKVKTMLSMFSPDDPAVAALKASPVYQDVAHLIEV